MKALLQGFVDTPPLWKKQQFGLPQFQFPSKEINAFPSVEWPTNLRLGHQMEVAFKYLVASSNDYKVVLSNILVEEGKTRIGELDFILENLKTQQHIHVELAYKFYIINPEISEPIYRLMGPNKRDMFYTKLDKLKGKQFPLLHHPSLTPYWKTRGIDPITVEQECCFKAQLFQPFGEKISIRPLNRDCISGAWIQFDNFNTNDFSNAAYYIPRKLEWVVAPHPNVHWMTHFETLMEVNLSMVKENAPMLWMRQPSGEIKKLFVVWW